MGLRGKQRLIQLYQREKSYLERKGGVLNAPCMGSSPRRAQLLLLPKALWPVLELRRRLLITDRGL
jgi:hypothetical protein